MLTYTDMQIMLDFDNCQHYLPLQVGYNYFPEAKGTREVGTGIPLEPDTMATVEIESVKLMIQKHPVPKFIDFFPFLSIEQVEAMQDDILEDIRER